VFVRRVVPGFRYLEALTPAMLAMLAAMGVCWGLGLLGTPAWGGLLAGAAVYAGMAMGLCGGEMRRIVK